MHRLVRSAAAHCRARTFTRALCASSWRTYESGLKLRDLTAPEEGRTADDGDAISVHYTGRLDDGTVFDTSLDDRLDGNQIEFEGAAGGVDLQGWDRGTPLQFTLGAGEVIPGWDEGLHGMRPGGRRELVVPPSLGYGDKGAGDIPPGAVLHFEVELLTAREGEDAGGSLWRTVSGLWGGSR